MEVGKWKQTIMNAFFDLGERCITSEVTDIALIMIFALNNSNYIGILALLLALERILTDEVSYASIIIGSVSGVMTYAAGRDIGIAMAVVWTVLAVISTAKVNGEYEMIMRNAAERKAKEAAKKSRKEERD